jgi:hypothetical protein
MLGVLASDAPLWSDEVDLESLLPDVRIRMNSRAADVSLNQRPPMTVACCLFDLANANS